MIGALIRAPFEYHNPVSVEYRPEIFIQNHLSQAIKNFSLNIKVFKLLVQHIKYQVSMSARLAAHTSPAPFWGNSLALAINRREQKEMGFKENKRFARDLGCGYLRLDGKSPYFLNHLSYDSPI
jgi:hypothetical protein